MGEKKKKLWRKQGDRNGFGQAYGVSEEQKLDWIDVFALTSLPKHIRKPHIFDRLRASLRDTLDAYTTEIKNLSRAIDNNLVKSLKMEKRHTDKVFDQGPLAFWMNYYPECPQPELAIGLTPHSDASGLTLLLHATETEGLQIKKGDRWILVKPLPHALVVNVRYIMEIVTNGAYKIAMVDSAKERISIASFIEANLNGEIGPAPSPITPRNPRLFKRISNLE